MRLLISLLALSPLALQFCGASDEPPPPPPPPAASAATSTAAPATAAIELPAASHGGTVLAVEDRPVEVVVATDGQVSAWLPGPPPPPNTTVSVQVNTDSGPKLTTLEWNAESAAFEGEVVGAVPAPGPMEVGLLYEGRVRRGHANRVVVVAPPPPRARVDVRVQAPRPPRANVDIRINGPRPPPPPHVRVDVRVPRPPTPHVGFEVGFGRRHGMRERHRERREGHRRRRRRGHDDDDD